MHLKGWHDVGFHGSEIKTPNIDKLAYEGIILNNYYVQPLCTPTRGALMSGKYPIHTGLQHYVIVGPQPYGLPLSVKTLPQHLRSLGYSTHMVGKWHLGFFKKEYLPEHRGFDSHFGYYLGQGDYFDHHSQDSIYIGYDLHHNGKTVWNYSEVYSTEMYTRHAKEIIKTHNQSKPLFLYIAHQAVHAGNDGGDPIQAPQHYINRFPYIKDVQRRMFAGVVSALDDSVGTVYKALQDAGMEDNTIIVFSTDNGGPTNGYDQNAACNWPLRGNKNTLWQGGVRGVGLVHSPLLQKPGRVSDGMMHAVDWLPTLLQAAQAAEFKPEQEMGKNGIQPASKMLQSAGPKSGHHISIAEAFPPFEVDEALDGIGMWSEISGDVEEGHWPRQEVLLNIDPIHKFGSIIVGDYKLIYGKIGHDGWYPPPGGTNTKIKYINQSRGGYMNRTDRNRKGISRSKYSHHGDPYFKNRDKSDILFFLSESDRLSKNSESDRLSKNSPVTVDCGPMPVNASTNCKPAESPCLFNLRTDPCEYHNLAVELPEVFSLLQHRLHLYKDTMVAPGNKPADPKGDPWLHGGVWVPWL